MMKALQASSSMPLLSTPVALDGRRYLDGGPSMAVGYRKALEEGYGKVVLILTRQKGYRKSPFSPLFRMAIRRKFRKYPAFMEMMLSSPFRYNEMMDEIDRLEEEGVLFVLRPSEPVTVSRTEKDVSKLFHLYQLGKRDTEARLPALRDYLGGFS
jgi:predicted patatin/cPLA2 family phospholipase